MRTVVLFLILSVLASVVDAERPKRPKLLIKERVWNFGTIKRYKVVTHEFVLENKGNADLIINKVRSS